MNENKLVLDNVRDAREKKRLVESLGAKPQTFITGSWVTDSFDKWKFDTPVPVSRFGYSSVVVNLNNQQVKLSPDADPAVTSVSPAKLSIVFNQLVQQ